ncbi:MAG: hypothetical protein AB8B55_14705 [Mariniblastus sp.]
MSSGFTFYPRSGRYFMATFNRAQENRIPTFALAFVFLVGVATLARPLMGQETAADFFPETTAIYLHVEDPANLIETIETHPVLNYVLQMKDVQKLMRSPQFAMAMVGRGLLETQIEENVIEALKSNTAGGIWLGFDTETNGALVAFKAKDEARLKTVAGRILKLVATTAGKDGNDPPFKKKDYRDAVAAEFDGFMIARYKSWFVLTSKKKFAKTFVDNLHDGADSPLSKQDWFKKAVAQRAGQKSKSDVWAAVDLETVRELADDKTLFLGQTDNPGVELIFGGVLDALKNAPHAMGELSLNEHLDFSMSVPFDAGWANEARGFFFGEDLGGFAPTALQPKNLIASLTSYRDVGLWWLSKEDLYAENVIAQLAQADSQLSTIFSGMDFGEDVLGALEPGVQIIVTENTFDEKYIPDMKLPAFALVGKIKNPDKLKRKLRIAFQSVIGFANINLGMNGQPQLEVETETIGDTKLSSAEYFYEEGTEEGLTLFNFSPSVAFQGSHLILASRKDLAVELAKLVADGKESEMKESNTKIKLDGNMLHEILDANRESLVAQNMIEEGHGRKAAESQIGVLLTIADLFKDATLDYQIRSDEMKVDFALRFDKVNLDEDENSAKE